MDHSNDMSAATTKPQVDENKQMVVKKKIEQYFRLITQGCNRHNCNNPNCASNPSNLKISGNEAAVKVSEFPDIPDFSLWLAKPEWYRMVTRYFTGTVN